MPIKNTNHEALHYHPFAIFSGSRSAFLSSHMCQVESFFTGKSPGKEVNLILKLCPLQNFMWKNRDPLRIRAGYTPSYMLVINGIDDVELVVMTIALIGAARVRWRGVYKDHLVREHPAKQK